MDRIAGSIYPSPLKVGGGYGWQFYSVIYFNLKFKKISFTAVKLNYWPLLLTNIFTPIKLFLLENILVL